MMIDTTLQAAWHDECDRQKNGLEMIASENYASKEVLGYLGSEFTNKYAEGYPGKRYYGGCENMDTVERLAIERAKELFCAEHANVQPHSGTNANLAAYVAVLNPGDTILSMGLSAGGHLSHATPLSVSGKTYNAHFYGVNKQTDRLDYDEIRNAAIQCRPKLIICGASAYPGIIDFKAIRAICDEVGAYMMADIAHIAGLVASGLHPSPFPYADIVTTTTHKTLRGPRGGMILCKEALASAVDKAVFPATQGGPLMNVIAAKAQCLYEALSPSFAAYQKQVVANARCLAQTLMDNGIRLVTNGTENHLLLIDLRNADITGKQAEGWLGNAGITANKNLLPFDQRSPFSTSGVRLGTPALTTRGMKEPEMEAIGGWIADILNSHGEKIEGILPQVAALVCRFDTFQM